MNCANHPDRERIAFCQHCGKPLCAECSRAIGTGVFCEPCLAARLAGAEAASAIPPFGAQPFPKQTVAGIPVPANFDVPNPVLAAWLGFIPGVGAMYNGQYAKGVVHLIVFAVLVSLADSNGIFGLFIAGWEFYQAFEAYHTARARRDGTPLPNPFGLNDIGERLGFSKSWMPPTPFPGTAPTFTEAPPPASTAGTHFTHDTKGNIVYTQADGTPFTQSGGSQTFSGQPTPPPPTWSFVPGYSQPGAYTPPTAPFVPIAAVNPSIAPMPQNRFPAGALWLIGLGLLFFFGSTGILHGFRIHRLLPFLVIAFGVWLFVRRMTVAGQLLEDDGSPFYRQRLLSALRASVWVVLIGILFLLDTLNILSWAHSWPLFIILAGLMALLQRYAYVAPAAAFHTAASPIAPSPAVSVRPDDFPAQEGR